MISSRELPGLGVRRCASCKQLHRPSSDLSSQTLTKTRFGTEGISCVRDGKTGALRLWAQKSGGPFFSVVSAGLLCRRLGKTHPFESAPFPHRPPLHPSSSDSFLFLLADIMAAPPPPPPPPADPSYAVALTAFGLGSLFSSRSSQHSPFCPPFLRSPPSQATCSQPRRCPPTSQHGPSSTSWNTSSRPCGTPTRLTTPVSRRVLCPFLAPYLSTYSRTTTFVASCRLPEIAR